MPDFLTRRNGTGHFVRRIPSEFASFDSRGIIKHSTRIRIANDRAGRRAARVAEQLNRQLEMYWKGLSDGRPGEQLNSYENARRRARALGFEYIENDDLLKQPSEGLLHRLEAIVANRAVDDPNARAALLGTEKRPAFKLSRLFDEYEELTKDEVRDLSPNQLRVFTNGRKRAFQDFISVIGDKPITDITNDDAIDFCEWWRDRVRANEVNPKIANKGIGQLSRMLKEISVRRRLDIPDIFRGLRLKGEVRHTRAPFDTAFIREQLLTKNALAGLNEDARLILHVVAETAMRPSEVVNLQPNAIVLDAEIPYVRIFPDGRRLKTVDSEREIPLIGTGSD